MEALVFLIFIVVSICLYFIPFIIAAIRGIKNSMSVFFLNLFLGWTVIGFFVLIFYASLTNAKSNESVGEFIIKKKKKKILLGKMFSYYKIKILKSFFQLSF